MAAFSDRHLEPDKAETRFEVTSLAFQKVNFSTRPTLKVTHLGSAWNSSAGGLSTFNRELAIRLSEHPKVEVTFLVPEGACKDEEKREAQSCGITVVDARKRPGFDPLDWLSFPPKDLGMDVVVGHGVILGRQGQVIRDLDRFPNCKWVQVVHTAPEDLGKFKRYADPISKGERKHRDEVELCKLADLVVPVGPRLKEAYSSYLRRKKTDRDIFSVTPGLFDREFGDLKQSPNEDAEFKVLIFGRGDDEDFELKGYNIAAKAFTDHRLKQKPYHLLFVGAPDGKLDGISERLIRCGIDENQITVRSYIQSRDEMKDLFCEVDLAIMPSKTEGFGLVALEALSAGLPILVSSRSGFAKALEKVPDGKSCIVYSDETTKWAEAIEAVRVKHKMRLEEIKALRESYGKKYSWKEQCEALAEKMWRMVYVHSNAGVKKPQSDKQHPLLQEAVYHPLLQETVYKPHSSQQPKPSDEKRIFQEKEDDTAITSSNKNRKSAEKSKSISLSTSEEDIDFPVEKELEMNVSGKNEEGALSSRRKSSQSISKTTPDTGTSNVNGKSPSVEFSIEKQPVAFTSYAASRPPSNQQTLLDNETKRCGKNEEDELSSSRQSSQSISEVTCDQGNQAITVQIKITTRDLDDHQHEIFDELMQQMATQNFSTDEGLSALTEYLTESYSILQKDVTNCGLEIIVECSTPEIFESLSNDYHSGHLNEVAERCLVTDTIKTILNLETLRLKTVIQEVADQNPIVKLQEALHKLHTSPQPWQVKARSISESISNEELFSTEDTIPQVTEPQPAVETKEVHNPHSSPQLQPINGRSILLTNEKDERRVVPFVDKEFPVEQPVTAYTPNTVARPPSNHQTFLDQEEKAHGTIEDGASTSQSNLESASDTGTQAITVQLKITTPDLNDQQQEVFDDLIQNMLLFMDNHDPCKAEGQLGALIQYLVKSHKLLLKRFTNDGLEILLECPTLESLASLLKDHRSGHLNEVAERHIVTDKIKEILNLKIVRLKTVFEEETRFSEMLGAAGITRFPSKQNAPDQGASAKWTDTSPKRQKSFQEKKEDMNWMIRSEKAKASRGALHKASISGQCDTVKMLLESGQQVDQRDRFSLTPLHLACWYGQKSVVKLLLEHGANVNAVDRFDRTPLQKAERHNHRSIVQLLLKSNASPSYQQPLSLKSLAQKAILKVDRRSGFNLLQAAVFEGEYNIVVKVAVFLEDFVEEMNLKTTGNDAKLFPGKTAVDILSSLKEKMPGHAKIGEFYLETVTKYNTLTELHRCKSGNDAEKAVELVLNDGVDINIPALCNRTPLLWSSLSSSSEFIETLTDLGADVNAQRTDGKLTPSKLAANWNNYMAVCVLSEHGADANIQDEDGYTPLQFSVEKGQVNLVKLLLKNNADVNSQNIYGDAPLHNSVRGGFFNISQLLIEAGSNVNLRNKKGSTPLYIVVKNKREQLIKLLLESSADVSMEYKEDPENRIYLVRGTDRGKPAWHYVLVEKLLLGLFLKRTNGGYLDVADYGIVLKSGWGKDPPKNTIDKILKNHEYDAMFKEIQGETLLHVASRNNNIEIVDLLVKYGAWDVNARDAEGFTPLHVAAIHGNMQVVKKLVDLKADVNQAIGIADMAHMNEEFDIEEYLNSKVDSPEKMVRKEDERDVRLKSLLREAGRIGRQVAQVAAEVVVDGISRVF